jgi:hypothetical protein
MGGRWTFDGARYLGVAVGLLVATAACSGSEFSAADAPASGGAAGSSGGGQSGGSGGSVTSGGSGGAGATSGAGGAAGGVVAGCIAYYEAYCARAERCDQYLYGGSFAACRGIAEESCAWYELPGVTASGADFARCAAAHEASECGAVEPCELPLGTIQNGFPCALGQQCSSKYCTGGNGACGVCAPNPRHPAGGACMNPLVDCEAELDCVDSVCTPKRREGESCDDTHHCETMRELGSLGCVEGVCTVLGLPGEPCEMTEGGNPYCGVGTACTTENVCVLVENGDEGDVCGTFADRVVGCPDGSCEADADDPTLSHCANWAEAGESCKKVPGFERCATGLVCMNSLCVWPPLPPLPEDCG